MDRPVRFWIVMYKFFVIYYLAMLFWQDFIIVNSHKGLTQFCITMACILLSALSEWQERHMK